MLVFNPRDPDTITCRQCNGMHCRGKMWVVEVIDCESFLK
jgi:hypothetical protein